MRLHQIAGCLPLAFICLILGCRQEPSDKNPKNTQALPVSLDTIAYLRRADSLYRAAENFDSKKDRDSAQALHQEALRLRTEVGKNNRDLAASNFKVGLFYLSDFKYDVADPYLEKARLISDQCPDIDPLLYIEIYLKSADAKSNLMDVPSALSLLVKAQALVLKNFPDDHLLLARVYHSQSASYFYAKQYEKAIDHVKKSIELIPALNHRRRAVAYDVLALYYKLMKRFNESLHYFNKSIEENLKWTDRNSNELAIVYLQKSFALVDVGQMDSAKYFLLRNLEIRQKVYGRKNVNTFGAFHSLAIFEYTNGAYDSSAYHFQQSLIALIKDFNTQQLTANPIPNPTELNSDLVMGLAGKAKALRRMALVDSSTVWKELSLRTYLLADSIFSIFRNSSNYDDPKLRQLETGYMRYDEMTALAFELFSEQGDPRYAKIALEIMERSRAILLQNALQRTETYNLAGVDPQFKIREKELMRQRAELLRLLGTPGLSTRLIDSLRNNLLDLDVDFSRFKNELRERNPTYYTSKYQQTSVNLAGLQKFLKDRNSILLEYLWSDSAIYLLRVTPDSIHTNVVHQTPIFRKAFQAFTKEMKAGEASTIKIEYFVRFCNSANLLYNELVRNTIDQMPPNAHLIISADGPLSIFPFESLIKQIPQLTEIDYRLPYLALQCPISYTYSSNLLLRNAENSRHGNKLLALGYAGSGLSREKRNGLSNLPGTKQELTAIREVMQNHTNKYYLEAEASELMFKESIREFNVAHLALHGVSDTLNSLESRIIFRSETDTVEDGQLYAHEVYDLDLSQLDLAVLSACESGIGKLQTGEGMMSLARGFAYAGCPSLVMSLWKLDDKTAAQVMSSFYRHLADGEMIDVSLANAKKDYLSHVNEFNSHPAYWSAFISVGSTDALDLKKPNWLSWAFVLTFSLILIYIVSNRKRRERLKGIFIGLVLPKKLR